MATSNTSTLTANVPAIPRWRLYLALTKPKVVALIILTAVVGTLLAAPGWPPLDALILGNLGIGLAAASAATINQLLDQRIDAGMLRTNWRPLPTGGLSETQAIVFATVLGVSSMVILVAFVNTLTAVLTFASLIGYAVVYTVWLKRATPQNIVIGGAAGAAPPVLGWAAVTGTVDANALLLFLIIFVETCVVVMLAWPSISWMERISAPFVRRVVAKEWRSVWAETFLMIFARRAYSFIIVVMWMRESRICASVYESIAWGLVLCRMKRGEKSSSRMPV